MKSDTFFLNDLKIDAFSSAGLPDPVLIDRIQYGVPSQ